MIPNPRRMRRYTGTGESLMIPIAPNVTGERQHGAGHLVMSMASLRTSAFGKMRHLVGPVLLQAVTSLPYTSSRHAELLELIKPRAG